MIGNKVERFQQFLQPKQQLFDFLFLPNKYINTQQPTLMQRQSFIINNPLYDQVHKLRHIGDVVNLNKDFLLGFILKDADNVRPEFIKDLNSVLQLLIEVKNCQVINKDIFLEIVVVFSHVSHSINKHHISSLMQFYQESIGEVTNDPNYFKTKYFRQDRQQGKIMKNLQENQLILKILQNESKIQEKRVAIEAIKSRIKMQEQKPKPNKSEMKVAELVRNKSQLAECPICMVQVNYESISILACGHIYHKQCFEHCMKESILNKRFPLVCPVEQCTKNIQTDDVEEYLSKDLLQKYYEFTLHNFVDKNSKNMTWCPTPGCTNAFQFDEYITQLICSKCSKSYCLKCKTDSHPEMTCEQNREMMNVSEEDKQFLNYVKGAKYKQCPKCKFWVSKNKGCCHMTCRCSYEFCYVCGSRYGDCNCKQEYENYYGSPEESQVNDNDSVQENQMDQMMHNIILANNSDIEGNQDEDPEINRRRSM